MLRESESSDIFFMLRFSSFSRKIVAKNRARGLRSSPKLDNASTFQLRHRKSPRWQDKRSLKLRYNDLRSSRRREHSRLSICHASRKHYNRFLIFAQGFRENFTAPNPQFLSLCPSASQNSSSSCDFFQQTTHTCPSPQCWRRPPPPRRYKTKC